MINLNTLLRVFLFGIVYIFLYLQQVNSLVCHCNICGDATDQCETSIHKQSSCFRNSERVRDKENNKVVTDSTYGCISGSEDSISNLQCHTNTLAHHSIRYIACCNGTDFCNLDIPEPTLKENSRWDDAPPIDPEDNQTQQLSPLQTFITNFPFLTMSSYLLSLALILVIITQIVRAFYRYCQFKRQKQISGSLCSLKADLERLHGDPNHHLHHVVSISSASTHSYSLSDDLCHKSTPSTRTNIDDTYIHQELTSGIGERMLNQRTMARAVGFSKTDDVGSGRFGRVFRGKYHGDDVAVKAFSTIDQDSWSREDSILRLLNHENIVRFWASEVCKDGNEIWMFLEYCPDGSLCDFLDHNEIIGQQQAVMILYSIINGLNYLHEDYQQASKLYKPSIAHRDIKSKNILMRSQQSCCIADFGHALIKVTEDELDYGKYDERLQVGTIRYMAPEILLPNNSINYRQFLTFAQADLYQYGLIMWEVAHRTALDILHPADEHLLPYGGIAPFNPSLEDMIKIVCEGQIRPPRYEKWGKYPTMKRLADLMVECWRPNPRSRMETLGVKKRLKEMFDQLNPTQHSTQYTRYLPVMPNPNICSLPSNLKSICDKTKSAEDHTF